MTELEFTVQDEPLRGDQDERADGTKNPLPVLSRKINDVLRDAYRRNTQDKWTEEALRACLGSV
ncbi:MAG: hypothetical protein QM796_05875 [Chthoniobacteraceae bacterium]